MIKIWFDRSKIFCAECNRGYMSNICAKNSDSMFHWPVLSKIQIFQEIAQHFTYSQKLYIYFKYLWNNCFYPINFMAIFFQEYSIQFCQLWTVKKFFADFFCTWLSTKFTPSLRFINYHCSCTHWNIQEQTMGKRRVLLWRVPLSFGRMSFLWNFRD